MFQKTRISAQVSQQIIELLTDQDSRDLTKLRLDDLENEICELVDSITCRSMKGILQDQAQACSEHRHCSQCGREFQEDDVSMRETTLTSRRGEITFDQPVKRCQTCRRDFFPSGPGNGN